MGGGGGSRRCVRRVCRDSPHLSTTWRQSTGFDTSLTMCVLAATLQPLQYVQQCQAPSVVLVNKLLPYRLSVPGVSDVQTANSQWAIISTSL